jgi:hypothetical protein
MKELFQIFTYWFFADDNYIANIDILFQIMKIYLKN